MDIIKGLHTLGLSVFIAVIIVSASLGVHEGVHWIQGEISPTVQPVGIVFFQNESGTWEERFGAIGVKMNFTTTNRTLMEEWKSQSGNREFQAYAAQCLFVGVSLCLVTVIFEMLKRGKNEKNKTA
jgi:hypothetical protein